MFETTVVLDGLDIIAAETTTAAAATDNKLEFCNSALPALKKIRLGQKTQKRNYIKYDNYFVK